ncbi:MAG: hypothetical protein HRU34_05735 [Richelia sp.]|nr:hypothetical protein [Richelia sp.]
MLENYLKTEIIALNERLKNYKSERDSCVNYLASEQRILLNSSKQKFSQFDEQMNNTQRELREQCLEESKKKDRMKFTKDMRKF